MRSPAPREPFVLHGERASVSPETFRRQWPEPHVPYTAPVHPEPEIRATVLRYALLPKGPVLEPGQVTNSLPKGAKRMISALHGLPGWGLIVSYARGHVMNVNGTCKMSPIWEKSVDEGGKATKKKIGSTLPDPAHNILVRGYAQNDHGLVFFAGQWINGSWDQGHVVVMPNIRLTKVDWQLGTKRGEDAEREREIRKATQVPTLSEWLDKAPTMTVKPDPPAWPPAKGMMF